MQSEASTRVITEHGFALRCRLLFLWCFLLAPGVGAGHLYRDEQPRIGARVAEILLLWLVVICVGIASVLIFVADALR